MPTAPTGRGDAVEIESGRLMVIGKVLDAVCDALSVTWTVKLEVPAADGVPLITPADDSVRPAGSAPAVTDQAKGGVPPVAVNVCE